MEKSKIDIIIVKKEIGGLVSAYKMNQKIFILSDFIEKYPFLDINNKEYFEIKTVELLSYGTKVKYQGESYHIIKVVGFKQFCADLIYGNDVVPVYGLSKSKYGKLEKEAVGIDIKLFETYWFINSSGKICSIELGKDDEIVNKIEVLDKKDKNQDEELVEDLVQIISVFSCKIQGKRKTKTKQLIDDFSKKITELDD